MTNITGTNGNDTLTGTEGSDTINPLLGRDTVDGLGDSDTLIVDYSSAPIDPYAGASIADVPSIVSSNGGSFSGAIKTVDGGNYVTFSSIEHLQVKLDFWGNRFILDASALALGATVVLDGGAGTDTLEANLSALASVDLQFGPGGTTASFGTIISFETFRLNLTEGADNVTTGAGHDTLTGNGGDDVLSSGGGNDILSGGTGSNSLNAGDGDDSITSSGIDTVDGGGGWGYDRWMGDYGSSTANLGFVRDRAAGTGSLSNGTTLTGIEQVMFLTTGSGDDVFTIAHPEGITIVAGAGEDRLNLTGNAFSGVISADGSGAFRGNLNHNRFSGIEHLNFVSDGGADFITVDAAPLLSGATLSLDAAGGSDTLAMDFTAFGSISFVVAAGGTVTTNAPATLSNFETYRITSGAGDDTVTTGSGDDLVWTNGGNDIIDGAGGNDQLDGGSGADAMTGGIGNDTYIVDDAGDTVTENAGEGSDEIRTGLASFSLGALANIENLTGTSAAGQSLTGNGSNNIITGGSGNDVLDGLAGGDIMVGRAGNDRYHVDSAGDYVQEFAGAGSDRVFASVDYTLFAWESVEILSTDNDAGTAAINLGGNELGNIIHGNAGHNILNGKGGTDWLGGLGGDDFYYVDSAGDFVAEAAGGGFDRVFAGGDYTLYAGQEIEILSTDNNAGTAAIALGGNALDNIIYGNAGANILYGKGGNDWLEGLGGSDQYFVDSAGDYVREVANAGSDRIFASADYTLYAGQSVEILSTDFNAGTAAIALGGNELDNVIYGNAGANILYGKGGNDWLEGLSGDDSYYVDSAGDYVREVAGGGNDRIFAGGDYTLYAGQRIEILSTDWNAGTAAIALGGNELDNVIYGNDGANILYGKEGNDTLLGLGGNDQFWFNTALGATNVDAVYGFASGGDKLVLFQSVFAGLSSGSLPASAFVTGSAAQDADDRIVYNSATGALLYDSDGSGGGAAVQFATLNGAPPLTASDFIVI